MANRSVEGEVAQVVGEQWSRVMGALVADLGDLSLAEDAAQDAVETALLKWQQDGIPRRPGAWITTVARRKAIDRLRRDKNRVAKSEQLARLERLDAEQSTADAAQEQDMTVVRDDQLRLIYGCCHPALSLEAQTALTLRAVCGLTTTEIAAAFIVPEATLAQRLVRAKRKIRSAVVPFRIPPDAELMTRTRSVHHVVYLLFNEGYSASGGDELVRADLCDEAIRLGRLLADLLVDDAESWGLVALMLLTHSRRHARSAADGSLVLLADQDRSLWDSEMIAEGTELLDRAMRRRMTGPYQLQAAIAALQCEARSAEDTDWPQIEMLYRRWLEIAPTPVVELNWLSAKAMAVGPEVALTHLDASDLADTLGQYGPYWALRADLLKKLGRSAEAKAAYETAAEFAGSEPERLFLMDAAASTT